MKGNRLALTQKVMFRLLPIQILLATVGVVNGIVSSLFAGNYVGVKAMTAVGLYNPVSQFILALNTMLVSGSTIICGQHLGRNDPDKVKNVFSVDMFVAGGFALLLAAGHLIFAIAGSFVGVAGDPEVSVMLCSYVLGQAIGVIPLVLGSQLSSFLSLDNKGSLSMKASLVYIAVNFVLNYLFVAVMHLEAFGLALAPAIGLWVFFLAQIPPFLKKDALMRFTVKNLEWRETSNIVKIGVPGAANSAYIALRGVIVNSLILAYVGGIGISAFTASNSVLSFFWQVPWGMLLVSRMMISVNVGEENRQSLTDTMRVAMFRFVPLLAAMSVLIILLAEPFTRFYFRDPSDPVYMMTVRGFQILPLAMPLCIICTHFSCYYQASDRQPMVHLLAVLDGAVGVVAFAGLLIGKMGMDAIYVANVLNSLIAPIVVLIYAWVYNKHFPRNMDELMAIPPSFGVSDADRMDVTLYNMDEVTGVSASVQRFCLYKGIDKRRSFLAGLFLEEMAGNVVKHGFAADKKKHQVNICVACKSDMLILSLKDDCIPFNMKQWAQMMDQEDMTKNIGIRIVSRTASDIQAQNILGLNVLAIRLYGERKPR